MWCHLITDIERKFFELNDAEDYVRKLNQHEAMINPCIPRHITSRENRSIPRICISPSLCLCIQSIGVMGIFRRAVNASDWAKSYEIEGNEVYPIIRIEFNSSPHVYYPDLSLVPDAHITQEHWLLVDTYVKQADIVWLD